MKYYLLGIGGISMSGIAQYLKYFGHEIVGSDAVDSKIIEKLKRGGIKISIGHKPTNIDTSIDKLIYSSAVIGGPGKIELESAKKFGIPTVKRSKMIGEIMKNKFGIAVSGMHGKTTLTAMIGTILINAGLDPTIFLGGQWKEIDGNVRIGKGLYILSEACEYDRSFLDFYPKAAVITNIEPEHLDYFRNLAEIIDAFKIFVKTISPDGFLIACYDNANVRKILNSAKCEVITYGFDEKSNIIIKNVEYINKQISFQLESKTIKVPSALRLKIPGIHNILNATAAIIFGKKISLKDKIIVGSLEKFGGVDRRFEILGEKRGVIYIDDYAHHPTEIKKTLEAARQIYHKKRLWVVFQPHQYSRTKLLLDDFAHSFGQADKILIPPVYEVIGREEDKSVGSKQLTQALIRNGKYARYFSDFEQTQKYLTKNTRPGDIVITMGAGPVNKIAQKIINSIE